MFGSPRAQRPAPVTTASSTSITGHSSALSQLQPAQVRTLREGFQILDRDSDGTVNREDVADMLNQLGRSINEAYQPHQEASQGCNLLTVELMATQACRLPRQKCPAFSLPLHHRRSRLQPFSTTWPPASRPSLPAPSSPRHFLRLTTTTVARLTWRSFGMRCYTPHRRRERDH